MQQLEHGNFRKDFTETFRGDESGDRSPRQTPGVLYSTALPTPVKEPRLLAWNHELAEELGIAFPSEKDIQILGGNKVTPSMKPYANCYAGHQFGNWAGQLGDGRAITLGEWPGPAGSWELQLKGAGPTAYSRMADGRAVLRSSVREYLMSEAMHHLNIPTTRALSLVTTGEDVMRDMFYDGNPEYEPGAIVLRAAPSFLRFGSFEMPAARRETENLQQLVDWTISRFYSHLEGDDKVLQFFREVTERTARLMVEWQRVGFVHGVMNTDNMSILGLTIDYGPYSFMDDYDPNFTPNTTDLPGRRYAFGNQASIGYWNCGRLASALLPLFDSSDPLEEALHSYEDIFWEAYYEMMGRKLGLSKVNKEDQHLIAEVENLLADLHPDMTIFYYLLSDLPEDLSEERIIPYFEESFYSVPSEKEKTSLMEFIRKYSARLKAEDIDRETSRQLMKSTNPKFILRNYLLHQAIEELEKGSDTLFRKLEQELKNPYSGSTEFFSRRPDWATKKAGCSMLSCSS